MGRQLPSNPTILQHLKEESVMRVVTILLILLFLVSAGYAQDFEQLFNTRIDYGTNEGSMTVFASDLNGDDYIDLAVANVGSHESQYF